MFKNYFLQNLSFKFQKLFSKNIYISNLNPKKDEEKLSSMEEKAADALEMAAKAHEEREKAEKAAQGQVNIFLDLDFYENRKIDIDLTL